MAKKILIMNLTRMGDLIQSTPLIAGLRRKHPGASITLMVLSNFAAFAKRIPEVDDILEFNLKQLEERGGQGQVNWVEVYRFLESYLNGLKERGFDLLINLSHSKLSALMIRYLGIRRVVGFACHENGDRKTDDPWMQYFGIEPFNRSFNSYNLVDIFTRSGGVEPTGKGVEIISPGEDFPLIAEKMRQENIHRGDLLIGIQAGASLEGRRWPPGAFAELADLLIEKLNARILLFGVDAESEVARQVTGQMKRPEAVVDLTGKTSIPELIAWVRECAYLVTNDTGTMHIGAAVGTTLVGLFFAHAHPIETGPYGEGHVVFQARIPCAPCSYGVECNNVVCVQKVSPRCVYRMMAVHRDTGAWDAGTEPEDLREVNVFETRFDDARLLRMKPLIRRPVILQDVFREAYRWVWVDELGSGISGKKPVTGSGRRFMAALRQDYDLENRRPVWEQVRAKLRALEELMEWGGRGARVAKKIIRAVKGGSKAQAVLQELGDEITRIDDRIGLLGLTHVEVKPVTDMFNKRKENLGNENVMTLARATETFYVRLVRETSRLRKILAYAGETSELLSEPISIREFNSIKVAVPGR